LDIPDDVTSDMHRFHGLWVSLDEDDLDFAGLSGARFFTLAERLVSYDGVVTARVVHYLEEQKKHNPSADAISKGAKVVEGSAAVLASPDLADLFEVVKV
jgi:hypothetical protein